MRRISVFVFLVFSFSPKLYAACEVKIPNTKGLKVEPGFLEFMQPDQIQPYLKNKPKVANEKINDILQSPRTIWYDEASMVFLYQDSIESVVGGRANCVGRDVGERNKNNPGIEPLRRFFGPDYRFKFPFRTAAGTDDVENVHSVNFWSPPLDQSGKAIPVKYWREGSRGRWRWVFPKGTVFGEILLQKSPQSGEWYAFEVRTRTRYLEGWDAQMFRPFVRATDLAYKIMEIRPNWQDYPKLKNFLEKLTTPTNIQATRLEATKDSYAKIFQPIDGFLDVLPSHGDPALFEYLLSQTVFVSNEGKIWKENKGQETYGPASADSFSIVPANYKGSLFPVNEESCKRCHVQVGHPLGNLEFIVQLYGEIWGEDQIFTWHPFLVHYKIFGTFDDSDSVPSRILNPRLVQANLITQGRPAAGDKIYKELPRPFK